MTEEDQPGGVLPDDTVVIRGGRLTERDFSRSIELEAVTGGTPGLSVLAAKGHTASELAFSAELPHPVLRQTTVGRLRALGYDVVPDPGDVVHHCLVTFASPPSSADWGQLNGAFALEEPNPARR